MHRVTVNGQQTELESGTTLLAALERAGIHVPHLCHDERMAPAGACRLCSVRVQGAKHAVAACSTPVEDGMVIETHTPELEASRRASLTMLARHYPKSALQGAALGSTDNVFLRELRAHGLEDAAQGRDSEVIDDSHPYIRVDMSKCVSCYRCERICSQLQGQNTWSAQGRGRELRFVPDSGTTLRESSCVSCGACADSCPSGALTDKTLLTLGAPTHVTRTTCPYCGVGCELQVGTRNGRVVQVRPALDSKVSKGHLCVKGRYAFGFGDAADRVTSPLIREGNGLRRASWPEAIAFVAERLRRIIGTHGPSAVGVLGSARATNEESYLAQKLARVVLGTNNVDCCARVCHAPSAAALSSMLGTGAATGSFDDIECAQTLLVFGANATENHPIVGARLRQAALRGAKLIVVDPRAIELTTVPGALHLPLRPGTNIPLLHAMACTIVTEGLADADFIASRVEQYEEYRGFIAAWTPERAAQECGVDAALIRKAARIYATHKPAMCLHGLGATEHVQGTAAVQCVVNLALLTGNLGVPGAGVNPLRGQNNVQGSAHMGCEPHHLTGYASVEHDAARFEQAWGAPVPRAVGLDLMQMMDAAERGELKALLAIGYDVLLTNPNTAATRSALSKLELVVVQDMFLTETAREFGSVLLPVASAFEKDGTFMNAERRVQRVRRAIDPPGEARSDSDILCALATELGHGAAFSFQSAEQIWNEVRSVWPAGAGISYARLEHGGLQWPCPTESHPGTTVLHEKSFAGAQRAALRRIDYEPTSETVDAEYPLLLVTGRKLYQFNAGTMTGRTLNTELQPADVLDIGPTDAQRYGLCDGDVVTLRSRHGTTRLPARISSEVAPGQLFATFHTAAAALNQVTSRQRDATTHTPEYKVTAVQVSKA